MVGISHRVDLGNDPTCVSVAATIGLLRKRGQADRERQRAVTHGRVQLQVLDFLLRHDEQVQAGRGVDPFVALVDIASGSASSARMLSVHRAAISLAEEGLIVLHVDGSAPTAASADRALRAGQAQLVTARLARPGDQRPSIAPRASGGRSDQTG
jgi:hypothetical protein